MGTGAYQAGFFFDLTGNYARSFLNATGAGVVNLLILTVLLTNRWRRLSPLRAAPSVA